MTPMMEQYLAVKEQHKDEILFYRLGDFYEMFFDDAILASRVLDLTLTGRDCGEAERAPMCGVPFHVAETYIGRLVEKGYKVTVCEQMEDPATAQGLVKRDVIRTVTPGTLIEETLLPERRNNFLCTICLGERETAICFADISTAEAYATTFDNEDRDARIRNELGAYLPREILCNLPGGHLNGLDDFMAAHSMIITEGQGFRFDYETGRETVARQFGDRLKEGTLDDRTLVSAVGALLSYIKDAKKKEDTSIRELHLYAGGQFLEMDVNTRRNLELTETMRSKEKHGSLLGVIDETRTSAGARMLRGWVEHPLRNPVAIRARQEAIAEFCEDYMLRQQVGEELSHVLDMERLITRIVYGTANARDLRAVCATASVLPEVYRLLIPCKSDKLWAIREEMDLLKDVREKISSAIEEEPPVTLRDGGMIAKGYDADLDRLREVVSGGKGWIEKAEAEEREKTGIKNLRIGYNKVFGYYIEVTNSYREQVPANYIRKQTLSNCERYITDELKRTEATILGAADRICSLEYEIFQSVREFVAKAETRIRKTAALLAELDVYLSLASVAKKNKYVCPEVDQSDVIDIRDGRHPVVEKFVKGSYFVPNDTLLDTAQNRLMLITGPNMAGKSTYMRQVALTVVLAQIGSFVPASSARIGIVDKMFTRVGASDDLASGQSTFMLEMNEVSYILRNATKKSLIIYDEVGRGTSTFDGMSIARAIVEYTNGKKIGARTLFATHYHELTSMENEFEGIINYNIAAKKRGDDIVFLRKIVRGSTDDSYGIEVAKLAGIPNEVIKRAREVLASVEATAKTLAAEGVAGGKGKKKEPVDPNAITMDECLNEQIIAELRATDINAMSPFECMSFLFDLKKRLP